MWGEGAIVFPAIGQVKQGHHDQWASGKAGCMQGKKEKSRMHDQNNKKKKWRDTNRFFYQSAEDEEDHEEPPEGGFRTNVPISHS